MPRYDMGSALRILADRAEAGEFDSLALVATLSKSAVCAFMISTPNNAFYQLVGGIESLKKRVFDQEDGSEKDCGDFENEPDPA